MRRILDVVLIALFLTAAGIGAYEIGHRVDRLSNQSASHDSELNHTTTTTVAAPQVHTIAGRHITPLLVLGALGVVLLALIGVALLKSALKGRKREHWHVPN